MTLLKLLGKKLFGGADERSAWISITLYYNSDIGFLIVPTGRHAKFDTVAIEPVVKLDSDVSEEGLGEGILSSFALTERAMRKPFINVFQKNAPDVIAKASGIKNFPKFSKMYRCIYLSKSPHGYKVQEWLREPKYGSYQQADDTKAIYLSLSASAREFSQAIKGCLAVKHEPTASHFMQFQLFDGRVMRFKIPSDDYINVGDAHTDAHQVFEHADNSNVYFGFFYGTNYDPLDSAAVKEVWERYYGNLLKYGFAQLEEGPFSYIAKAEGKDKIIRALFFMDDGIWNEFLLHIDTSNLAKKQVKSSLADFEATAKSCVLKVL
jgi:hypothetical protein